MEADDTRTPPFVPGMTLSRAFYEEIVRPLVDGHLGGAPHSAARLDGGSDVLGFDTEVSRDHGWGPRVTIYLAEAAFDETANDLARALDRTVPELFRGYPTRFAIGA